MSQPGFNGTRQIVDIPAAGTLLNIVATGPARYVIVKESALTAAGAANVAQGFDYKLPNDNFTQLLAASGTPAAMEIGDRQAVAHKFGILLGNGPDVIVGVIGGIPATVLFKAQSATATPTSIEVTQYY